MQGGPRKGAILVLGVVFAGSGKTVIAGRDADLRALV